MLVPSHMDRAYIVSFHLAEPEKDHFILSREKLARSPLPNHQVEVTRKRNKNEMMGKREESGAKWRHSGIAMPQMRNLLF